jgi:TonB family protein
VGAILIVSLTRACSLTAPPTDYVIYKGEVIPIRPMPDSISDGAGWAVKDLVRTHRPVRGYIVATDHACRELATARGLSFERSDRWGAISVDWIGLHILSHEEYELLPGLPPERYVAPVYTDDVYEFMRTTGLHTLTSVVKFRIDGHGAASGAQVVTTSGCPGADTAALEAIREFDFGPAMTSGRPVPLDSDWRFDLDVEWYPSPNKPYLDSSRKGH